MEPTDQEYTVCFLYAQLRAEIVRCLTEYTKSERGSLAELKDRFSPSLSEEEKTRIKNVKQLIKAVEEKGVIGQRNVKYIKMLAEWLHLEELVKIIEKYERVCFGIVQRAFKAAAKTPAVVWEIIKGGVKTSAIHLKAVLSCRGVQVTVLAAALLGVYVMRPEEVEQLQTFLDLLARLIALLPGSVVFVLKVSSIASIKRLWKSYKDGSLKKSMKKDLNEIKELKELSKGEEIDVEVTIDEDEYHEVFWNLILSEVKANDARENVEKQPSLISRRHSVGCEQDVSRLAVSSSLPGVSQLHVRPWRHVGELNKVLNNFKSIKAKIEASEDTAIELKEVASMVEQEEKRLSEIRQELSELNIVIDATGFEKVKVEENTGLSVEGIDSGASTSLQAEKDKKQSDQSTQVPHPDQMTGDEKLSSATDARKAGEKLEEQSVVTICERMSETQQLLLKERFPFFKDDVISTELLDKLPCLTNEQKDQITNDEKNHLPSKAVETLVEKLKEHKEGFEQFVEALRKAELGHVAALLDANYFEDLKEQSTPIALESSISVTHDIVERIDLGASRSLQAEKERKMAGVFEYSKEELNYFRVCYVTTRILPDSLRTVFKQEWDNRYQASPYGTWQDTAKNGIEFYKMESPRRRKIYTRELNVIRNGNTSEWSSMCLFYAILYSDSVGSSLDPAVRRSVDNLRHFHNYVAYIPDGKLNESAFNSIIKNVIAAFASLNLSTAGIDDIRTQRTFPTEELRVIKKQLKEPQPFCILPTKPNQTIK